MKKSKFAKYLECAELLTVWVVKILINAVKVRRHVLEKF